MLQDIVQMGPMLILGGLVAGCAAEVTSRARGYGLLPDMILGLAGSLLLGATAWFALSGAPGMVTMFVIGCVGGALMIAAQRQAWRSSRLGT